MVEGNLDSLYKVATLQVTDTLLGSGRYGLVKEAEISGAKCAAMVVAENSKALSGGTARVKRGDVARGCELWSRLRHPNIVQFLGTTSVDSPLPVLVMEYFPTSLHQFLRLQPAQSIPLSLKISILHNVASGLAYLHSQSPPIMHGHLSAKKVFLDSGAVAKISVGMGVTVLPQPPKMSPYLPPEVSGTEPSCTLAVDIYSFGVLSLFTLTHDPPENMTSSRLTDESKRPVSCGEINHCWTQSMEKVLGELGQQHPLTKLTRNCLNEEPASRPTTLDIQSTLWQARVLTPDPFLEKNKVELVREMATLACAHVQMRRELETHDRELRDQIRGLLQGMEKQREMLPREFEGEEKEMVTEAEVAYIANFVVGIQANRLGRELGVTETALAIIESNCRGKHDEKWKRVEVLTDWIKNSETSTWSALVNALSSIGQKRVAKLLENDQGLQYCAAVISAENAQSREKAAETPQIPKRCNSFQLELELERVKKAQEAAESRLAMIKRELEDVSKRCEELEEEVTSRDEQIRKLKCEVRADEMFKKEMAEENLQLKLEIERLKRK
jgi:serine/threonine protein kinase